MTTHKWTLIFSEGSLKDLRKLVKQAQRQILKYLDERVSTLSNPRSSGRALMGTKEEIWRYRSGDYRILCIIKDKEVVVQVVALGHRKHIYDAH